MKRNWMNRNVTERIRVEPMTIRTGMSNVSLGDYAMPSPRLGDAWRLIQEHYDLSPSELQKAMAYCEQLRRGEQT